MASKRVNPDTTEPLPAHRHIIPVGFFFEFCSAGSDWVSFSTRYLL